MVEGTDFLRIILQLAHGCADFGLEIRLVGDRHAANSVGFEVLPDQFIGIAVGRIWWKIKQPQPAVQAFNKCFCFLGNVGRASIDNQENRALGTCDQAFEKLDEDGGTLTFSRLAQRSLALRPAHSRCHQIVTRIPKASAISLPPQLLRLLPAGAVAGRVSHPLENAAFSRRTPFADSTRERN